MDLALYLYHSPLVGDWALLPEPPKFNASSYTLFDPKPLLFTYSSAPDDNNLEVLALQTYYSSERGDYQTTTKTLEELNKGGGSYSTVVDVWSGFVLESPSGGEKRRGAVLSTSNTNTSTRNVAAPNSTAISNTVNTTLFSYFRLAAANQLTPLQLTYSDSLHTAITAPWVGNDVNELFGLDESPFRASSTILGYAKAGSCEQCNVMLSETFPR